MKRLIIAAIIPLAFLLTSCGEKKINPNDYVTIEYSGYSEDATATVSFDADKMVTDYPDAFLLDKNYSQSDLNEVVDQINKTALGQLSKAEGISNGDEVTLSWDKNALSALESNYKVKWSGYKDIKETASGIPELKKFNPFDYLDISFEGKSPHITVNYNTLNFLSESEVIRAAVEKQSGMLRSVNFDINHDNIEYTTGDKITVVFRVYDRASSKFNDEDVVKLCKESGYLITQTEKEYTVE